MGSISKYLRQLDIPPLPRRAKSHRTNEFVNLLEDIWIVEQNRLDWRDLLLIHPLLLHLLKLFFVRRIEECMPDTVHKCFRRVVSVVCNRELCFDNWTESDGDLLANALETSIARSLREKGDAMAPQIRTVFLLFYDFIEQWDVDFYRSEFHARLSQLYLKKQLKYKNIMTLDPEKGPLSRLDEYALIAKVSLESATSRDAAIVSLIHAWGLRPRQVSLLNVGDLIVTNIDDSISYTLRVPRVKQHVGRVGESFRLRKLTKEVGERIHAIQRQREKETVGGDSDPMFERSKGSNVRLTSKSVCEVVSNFPGVSRLFSPVTTEVMKLNSRRLRETFGTRCAEMPGMNKDLLAEMLDHNSTRALDVYFDFRETIAGEIGALVAARKGYGTLRDVTEHFVGLNRSESMPLRTEVPIRFLPKLSDALNPTLANLRFVPPDLIDGNLQEIPSLGSCGGNFRCGLAPLAACYGCSDFEPWIEADHDLIAKWLNDLCRSATMRGARDDADEFALLKTKAEYVAERSRELMAEGRGGV